MPKDDFNSNTQHRQLISIDNYDTVSLNLQKMDALLVGISGEGFGNFRNMSEESQSWYLLTISQLSHEAVKAINDEGLNNG
jgi:hypothetical protein